jgi:small neutral amino acid transporter SnatA (MarC family)
MTDPDPAEQIARLEAKIERLAETAERCRKLVLISRMAVAAGGLCMAAMMLGIWAFDQLAIVCSITAVIGGIVVFGSNRTTLQQTVAAMKEAEARRSQLIDTIDLKPVTSGNAPV